MKKSFIIAIGLTVNIMVINAGNELDEYSSPSDFSIHILRNSSSQNKEKLNKTIEILQRKKSEFQEETLKVIASSLFNDTLGQARQKVLNIPFIQARIKADFPESIDIAYYRNNIALAQELLNCGFPYPDKPAIANWLTTNHIFPVSE